MPCANFWLLGGIAAASAVVQTFALQVSSRFPTVGISDAARRCAPSCALAGQREALVVATRCLAATTTHTHPLLARAGVASATCSSFSFQTPWAASSQLWTWLVASCTRRTRARAPPARAAPPSSSFPASPSRSQSSRLWSHSTRSACCAPCKVPWRRGCPRCGPAATSAAPRHSLRPPPQGCAAATPVMLLSSLRCCCVSHVKQAGSGTRCRRAGDCSQERPAELEPVRVGDQPGEHGRRHPRCCRVARRWHLGCLSDWPHLVVWLQDVAACAVQAAVAHCQLCGTAMHSGFLRSCSMWFF